MTHDKYSLEGFCGNIIGRVVDRVEITNQGKSGSEVVFFLTNGQVLKLTHWQACCEAVVLESVDGDTKTLHGKLVELCNYSMEENDLDCDHKTTTTISLKADGNTVVMKWVGESNGYYSEEVDWEDITNEINGEDE